MTTTFVLVHVAFASAAAWGPVSRELVLRGHRALAVDLPGHGLSATVPGGAQWPGDAGALATEPSAMAGVGTADDVALVADVVTRAAAHGPAVLVGHSRGGLTVTAVANAVPQHLSRLVYVSAWCPTTTSVADLSASEEHAGSGYLDLLPLAAADPTAIGGVRMRWGTGDPAELDALQRVLLPDGDRRELSAYLRVHDSDEALVVDEDLVRGDPARWGTVPRTFVRLAADASLPVALQDRMVREADAAAPDTAFDVVDLDASHVGVQLHPAPLVAVLDALA